MAVMVTEVGWGGCKTTQAHERRETRLTSTPEKCGPSECRSVGPGHMNGREGGETASFHEEVEGARQRDASKQHRSCLDLDMEEELSRANAAYNETVATVPGSSRACFAWKRGPGSSTEHNDTSPRSSLLSQCETSPPSPVPQESDTSTRSKRSVRFCPSTRAIERLPTQRFNASGLRRSHTELRTRYFARLGIAPRLLVAEAALTADSRPDCDASKVADSADGVFRQFAARFCAGVIVPPMLPPKNTSRSTSLSKAARASQIDAFDVDALARSSDASLDFLAGWCV
jgi:hypothetical protein